MRYRCLKVWSMNITNEKVTEYINSLYKPMNDKLGELRIKAETDRVPIILRDTETLLLNILRMTRPKKMLEIGAAVGYSSACFATCSQNLKVDTIERDEQLYEIAIKNLQELKLSDRVNVINGDACQVMAGLEEKIAAKQTTAYDMVFIDASKSHYREFWDCAIKLCHKDSIIICDNVLLKASTVSDEFDPKGRHKTNIKKMRVFLEYITSLEEVSTSVIPVGDGLSISVAK